MTVGLGSAVFQAPNNSTIMGSVPPTMLGVAAGTLATMRNLGMVTAVAVTGAIYDTSLRAHAAGLPSRLASARALQDAFLVSAIICAIGIFTSATRGRAYTTKNA